MLYRADEFLKVYAWVSRLKDSRDLVISTLHPFGKNHRFYQLTPIVLLFDLLI
jgi:hypothetical protein